MSRRASAARYARALFDVALREQVLERAGDDLAAFSGLYERHDDLRQSFSNPAVPTAAKLAVVDQLIARLTPSPQVGRLLQMLADRDRLDLLPDLNGIYRERLMDHQQVIRAEIVTAEALDADRVDGLRQRLASATGRTVQVSARVDPALVGGLVAKIGSTVYDGSVATQLTRMRSRLSQRT
ncbi:MAG: ATP synthase F1 subunit delta [Acidimicrobiia bacterium]|nr:ATP synthase F1 subunit delta [Acidimicrobiia bacterium]